jgi:aspartyl-tRNA synthetase
VIRTHEAGTLREEHAGATVTLAGWVARRRDHGGVAFLDLRDGSGVAQVVVRENDIAHDLRAEYCVRVVGEVRVRPRATATTPCRPARRGRRDRGRGAVAPRRCRSRSTTTRRSATRCG